MQQRSIALILNCLNVGGEKKTLIYALFLHFLRKSCKKGKMIVSHAKIVQTEKKIERKLIYAKVKTFRNKMASMRAK